MRNRYLAFTAPALRPAALVLALAQLTNSLSAQPPREAEPTVGEARVNEGSVRRPKLPAPEPAPPAVGVRRAKVAGGVRTTAVLPGPVVAVTLRREAGGRSLWLLTRPEHEPDGARTLWRLELAGEGQLIEKRGALPGELKSLHAVDLDGDGADELLAGGLGMLDRLPEAPEASLEPLVRDPGFDARSFAPERLRLAPWPGYLAVMEVGRAWFLAPDGTGKLERTARVRLPLEGRRGETGLTLTSPRPRLLPRDGALPLIGLDPRPSGKRRFQLELIDPADGSVREGWALLPGPETLNAGGFVTLGGQPFVVALTQSADRLRLTESQQLRVFPLTRDRTQKGRQPSFQAETDAARWHEIDLAARDLDGDGKEELVLLYRKGFDGDALQVEIFPGIGGGRFVAKPRRTKLDVADPLQWNGMRDLTGDGLADLVVRSKAGLAVFPGTSRGFAAAAKLTVPSTIAGDGPVVVTAGASTDGASVARALPDERPELDAADLDGDGREELILLVPNERGRGVLELMRFEG